MYPHLIIGVNICETTPRREAQEERRERRDYSSRRERWRAYAAAREAAAREPTPSQARSQAAGPAWSAMCEELAAVLRGWPVREIERDVRLSSRQRGPRDSKSAFTRVCDALCVAGCPSQGRTDEGECDEGRR